MTKLVMKSNRKALKLNPIEINLYDNNIGDEGGRHRRGIESEYLID